MRMHRQTIVALRGDLMKFFAGFFDRIDVHHYRRQKVEMMHQLMLHFFRDSVGFGDRQVRSDRHIQFGMQTMTEPSRPDVSHFLDCIDVFSGVAGPGFNSWGKASRQ